MKPLNVFLTVALFVQCIRALTVAALGYSFTVIGTSLFNINWLHVCNTPYTARSDFHSTLCKSSCFCHNRRNIAPLAFCKISCAAHPAFLRKWLSWPCIPLAPPCTYLGARPANEPFFHGFCVFCCCPYSTL